MSDTNETFPYHEYRVGYLGQLFFQDVLQMKVPKQLDLLDFFYPNLLVEEIPSDGNTKTEARFNDASCMIQAVLYHDQYYVGGSKRVTQIAGRLLGTAKGSQEKERVTARMIQKATTDLLVKHPDIVRFLRDMNIERLSILPEEILGRFIDSVSHYINTTNAYYANMTEEDFLQTAFPFQVETFEALSTDLYYQWSLESIESLGTVWTWLTLAALLRNEVLRLHLTYLSSLEPRIREDDQRITKDDIKKYGSFYDGDDLDKRFPGIEWYCDRCGEHLNEQTGFDDHLHIWTCQKCGYDNVISLDEIYYCDKEYEAGEAPVNKEDFGRALKERQEEIASHKKDKKTDT
ncbi:MAG: hypothetical protein MR799_01075 [Lachnospiraceae bacterium]|nr:hypothetical protein [Lachnospiraceae bacterium]